MHAGAGSKEKGLSIAALLLVATVMPAVAQSSDESKVAVSALAELRSLRVAQAPQLDPSKATTILPYLDEINRQREALAVWAAAQWQANRTLVEATLQGWRPGQLPNVAGARVCEKLHDEYLKNLRAFEQAVEKTAESILTAASIAHGLVEDAQAAERRRDMERRLDGCRSAPEFILQTAEALRLLMADDYAIV
ncbi:MAG: hypothetical protein N2512_10550, partial [Armatimonadetes bacterium]|nr:hypothetical protein [Armatimonadota bacterium]